MEMAKLGTTTGFFFTALNALSHSSAPKQINEAVRETVVLKTLQTTIHQQSCGPSWFLLRFAEGPAVRGFPSVVSGAVFAAAIASLSRNWLRIIVRAELWKCVALVVFGLVLCSFIPVLFNVFPLA